MLQSSLSQQRHVLIEINEEQRSLENVLDRTSQLYRQAHQERRNLVNTWKEAVQSMRSRDKEIEAKEKVYIDIEEFQLIAILNMFNLSIQ